MGKLTIVDNSILGTIVDRITGNSGANASDKTILKFDNGSVTWTIPATPEHLRGSSLFRKIRHLPPTKQFTGRMVVNRQGGLVKSITFE